MKVLDLNQGLQRIIETAEELGWNITISDHTDDYVIFDFQKYSPRDQDFIFLVEAENYEPASLLNNISAAYENFDPSYEAYLWLDETGHGKRGAPYEMGDVYQNMVDCQNMINELYLDLCDRFGFSDTGKLLYD